MAKRPSKKAGKAPIAPGVVVVTEHVRSNLAYGFGVMVAALATIAIVMAPFFSTSFLLVVLRVILMAVSVALLPMAAIQILNYHNRMLVLDAFGVTYTNCVGRSTRYLWDDVQAYDLREKQHSIMLVLGGRRRTFHESSENFDPMVDYLMDHVGLIAEQ